VNRRIQESYKAPNECTLHNKIIRQQFCVSAFVFHKKETGVVMRPTRGFDAIRQIIKYNIVLLFYSLRSFLYIESACLPVIDFKCFNIDIFMQRFCTVFSWPSKRSKKNHFFSLFLS
jgi:hypothetical protein